MANNIYERFRYYERNGAARAYILAGFAVQRERIEGLAVFSESLLSALHYLLNIEHREIEIKTLERSDAAYCNMRIEMRICNLRNGNMLLISSIEICKSVICVRESLQKTPRARRIRFHETIKILKFLILVFSNLSWKGKERKGHWK